MAGTILLLSNGHGEDEVAARLARALADLRPDLTLLAFPTVGSGPALRSAPVTRVGPLEALPSQGTTFRSAAMLWRDLRGGLLSISLRQITALRRMEVDVVIAVGDVWAEMLALLPPTETSRRDTRFVVQTLVSSRLDDGRFVLGFRVFRERFTWLERRLLARGFGRAYLRDADSAEALRRKGVEAATWLGNPMVDDLIPAGSAPMRDDATDARRRDGTPPVLALLPGTRDHAERAWRTMVGALELLGPVDARVPWAHDTWPEAPAGWTYGFADEATARLRSGEASIELRRNAFAEVLHGADLAVGTSGTAHEQAAALGLPVVAFPCGPGYTPAYLAGQRRLLGQALEIVPSAPEAIAAALRGLLDDPEERRRRGAIGRERMGGPGASRAIAQDVLARAVASGALPPAEATSADGDAQVHFATSA